jgi:hypothetical protein
MIATLSFNALTVNGTVGFSVGATTVVEQSIGAFRDFTSAVTTETKQQKFERLADGWNRDVQFMSDVGAIQSNPFYLAIIGMGNDAVPLILKRMQIQPNHWFAALSAITGVNPIKKGDRGNIPAMTAAWLSWGVRNGYVAS